MIVLGILGIIALVILFRTLDKTGGGCCGGSCNQGRNKCEDNCEDK